MLPVRPIPDVEVAYVPSSKLRAIVRDSDETIDNGTDDIQRRQARTIGERARLELTRRHLCSHCEICGYDDCQCGDTARGGNVVLVNEFEPGQVGAA